MQNDRPEPPPFDGESFGAALRAALDEVLDEVTAGVADGKAVESADGKAVENAADLSLDESARDKLVAFGTMLAERSRVVNLTRLTEPRNMAVLHFLDSYYLASAINPPSSRVCDIGTGGGVPGIPLAVMRPDLQVTLIDGTAKKIAFVKEAIDALGLANARAAQVRAEEHLRFNPYGAAVMRAAVKPGRMFEILEACRNSLESVVFMLGGDGPRIAGAVESRAYKLAACEPYLLPGQDRERYIATFMRKSMRKQRRTQSKRRR